LKKNSPFKDSRPPMLVSDVVKPSGSRRWKLFRWMLITSTATGITALIVIMTWLNSIGVFSIDDEQIRKLQEFSYHDNSIIYDRHGAKIGEFFEKYHIFVPYGDIPQHFIDAIVAIEDKNFFEHSGVDFLAIVRASLSRLKTGRFTQGASTITQQLIRHQYLNNNKTIERKVLEIALALKAEKHLSKEKILELYVNNMFLGNGAYGIGAASKRYFAKNARDLTVAESSLIAGLFQSPSRYNPSRYPNRAKKRQLQVIAAMSRLQKISITQAEAIKKEPLQYKPYTFINSLMAPWFVDYVHDFMSRLPDPNLKNAIRSGLRIHTTLDSSLQKLAEQSIQSHNANLNDFSQRTGKVKDKESGKLKHATVEASMLVTDPKTGDILAMVGGRNYKTSQFNRTVTAMRSPGSAFKPFVYTEALAKGFKWSDVILVSPVNIENYRPKNMKDDYLTETTMLRAFYRSMNSPTIEIAAKIGLEPIIDRAKSLGIRSPIKNEFGSALGSSDVTMLDLARAYGTYAAGGILTELSPISRITTSDGKVIWEAQKVTERSKRVLNQQLSYLVIEGMRSVLSVGTGARSADLASNAAGKTGTSNDSADNWFCGFTPDLVSIVWVGTDEHAPIMANISGASIALPIWDQFIRSSQSIKHPRPFDKPEGIVEAQVHPLYGYRIDRGTKMYFFGNKLPEETESALEKVENSGSRGYRNVFRH